MKRKTLASVLQVAGLLITAAAVGMVTVWAGVLTCGLGAVLFGLAVERVEP